MQWTFTQTNFIQVIVFQEGWATFLFTLLVTPKKAIHNLRSDYWLGWGQLVFDLLTWTVLCLCFFFMPFCFQSGSDLNVVLQDTNILCNKKLRQEIIDKWHIFLMDFFNLLHFLYKQNYNDDNSAVQILNDLLDR